MWADNIEDKLQKLLSLILPLEKVEQHPVYHPEGNALNHSLQVFRHAWRESDDQELHLAALLHDVGKQVESHGHEKHSECLIRSFAPEKTLWLVANHMRFKLWQSGEMKKLGKCKELCAHPWIVDLACLNRWDNMGRSPARKLKPDLVWDWCRWTLCEPLQPKSI